MSENTSLLKELEPEPYLTGSDNKFNVEPCFQICQDSIETTSDIEINGYGSNDNSTENNNCNTSFSYVPLHPVSTTVSHELLYLVKHSIPLFFTFFIQYLIQVLMPTYFASQIGPLYMSASGLSMTFFYLTGPAVVNGFSTALDTLCSTAYGAKHYHKVGHYYIQFTIILLLFMIPSTVFLFYSYPFFNFFTTNFSGYPPDNELAHLCSAYLRVLAFASPAVVVFESTKRFLQSQTKFSVPTKVVVFGVVFSFMLNLHFREVLKGTSYANLAPTYAFVINYWLMAILLLLYVIFIDGYQCLPPFDIATYHLKWSDFIIYFQLGIPGMVMILSEYFAFEVITILSTTFPANQLAAQSIIVSLSALAFQPPFAISICCSTHVANLIGAQSSNYKPAMKAIYILVTFLSIFNFSWFFLLRKPIASLFTNDPEILETTCKLAVIIAINQFLDCFNIICAAVLRGQGRQKIGSVLSLATYYLLGIPLELYFGFQMKLQVFGLWIGLAVGVAVLSLLEFYIVYNSNWVEIIAKNHKIA